MKTIEFNWLFRIPPLSYVFSWKTPVAGGDNRPFHHAALTNRYALGKRPNAAPPAKQELNFSPNEEDGILQSSSFSPDAPISPLERELERFARYLLIAFLIFTLGLGAILKYVGFLADFSNFFRVNGFSPMNASALSALYLAFLACRPSKDLIQFSLLLALIAEVFYQLLVIPSDADTYLRCMAIGGGTGLLGLCLIIYLYATASTPQAKFRARAFLLAALCLTGYPMAAGKGIGLLSEFSPQVMDARVYILEGVFGFFPAQEVARFLALHPNVFFLTSAVYSRLPFFIFLGVYMNMRYPDRCYPNVLVAFVGGGLIAFPLYFLLPMIGIEYFAGIPPWPLQELPNITDFGDVPRPKSFPRTCLPSLHTTWVLVFYFALARMSTIWRAFAALVVVLTLIATVGPTVGHYSLDIFVSVPYAVAVLAMATKETEKNRKVRRISLIFGFGSILTWTLAFRFIPQVLVAAPVLSWGLILLCCPVALWLESRLAKLSLAKMDDTSLTQAELTEDPI